jgi:ABC-type multidrug transport system fused ATPase/permease subunit
VQNSLAALERVAALFRIAPENNIGSGKEVERLAGEVEFREVSFSYDGTEKVLEEVSFHARPGERLGIVGPSGVGKTTLISLILCFYQPTRGELRFDGEPASAYEVRSLRQRIGYVSQSSLLLSGTIMENLRYGNPEARDEQVFRAAGTADIHRFIEGLPAGYDTLLGDGGISLSEGQRQRVALARALVKEPDILVLDEPTSALDGVTESTVFEALPACIRGKTLFIVSHRGSTMSKTDRVVLLCDGRLTATGSHDALLAGNAYYRELMGQGPCREKRYEEATGTSS